MDKLEGDQRFFGCMNFLPLVVSFNGNSGGSSGTSTSCQKEVIIGTLLNINNSRGGHKGYFAYILTLRQR